jgi:hypothetical protein
MSKTTYQIRELIQADREVVSKIIEKVANCVTDTKLLDLITASTVEEKSGDNKKDEDGSKKIKLSLEIIKLLIKFANEDVVAWFASLLNVSIEEFHKLPFDIEMRIIKQLKEVDEVTGFFTGVWQEFSGIFASEMQSKIVKKK